MKAVRLALVSLTLGSPVLAHPGHGSGGSTTGVLHYLTEPEHLFGGALALVIVAAIAIVRRANRGGAARR